MERRWPFLRRASPDSLNLGYDDVLEFQYARSMAFRFLVVGAYDGVANDPLSTFLATRECSGIFIEPQPDVFARLRKNFASHAHCHFVNAAIDQHSGSRELFQVRSGVPGFPAWTEQLASFHKQHIQKHEDKVPGLSDHITSTTVRTISFLDLIEQFQIHAIDVLQIDAEGVDAFLLSLYPFDRIRPGIVHYEIAHMTTNELRETRGRLALHGYRLYPTESPTDEMAVCI